MRPKVRRSKPQSPEGKKYRKRVRRLVRRVTLVENYLAVATAKPEKQGPVTDAVTKRVERLINLATDPAASEAESRTTALIAAKTIKREKLKLCRE